MRFLTDENVAPSTVILLRRLGHEVLDLKEAGSRGISDEEVFQVCRSEVRILFTLDRHFLSRSRFPASECGGIIVSVVRPNTPKRVEPLLESFLRSEDAIAVQRALVTLSRDGWRVIR